MSADQIFVLTKGEKRFLSRRVCGLCEQPLTRKDCGAMLFPKCSAEVIADRRARCLKTYKPRIAHDRRTAQEGDGE